jgi:2-polyprenyl-6-hydroxyphenyl methylase/3-demethylubiquinone-9 3-methyltransferase
LNVSDYYATRLSGERLKRCYEIASPRVREYLEAEIRHVLTRLRPTDVVLELGCGYGRVAVPLATMAHRVVGIDTARESLRLARRLAGSTSRCQFLYMNALNLSYPNDTFDVVVCVQNGICAFDVNREALLREALRVTSPDGRVLFSTYSDRFWPERLAWFEAQAAAGLLGPIDYAATRDGVIVCKDGFRAGRLTAEEMESLCSGLGVESEITEVDRSSVFCEIRKREHGSMISPE